jgi:8-oxo-dGTP pyrophosphatase MutT (NUDIX family)
MKMSMAKIKQQALNLEKYTKRDVRTQFGALCWRRRNGKVQVLLVTTRKSKRWIIPKGWPQDGATPAQAAITEAWEEAGVKGKVRTICIGIFSYLKGLPGDETLPCVVAVFPVKVTSLANDWPEKKMRKRKWVSPKKAAALVSERELAGILLSFDPRDT